jgi:hypothetical protein
MGTKFGGTEGAIPLNSPLQDLLEMESMDIV